MMTKEISGIKLVYNMFLFLFFSFVQHGQAQNTAKQDSLDLLARAFVQQMNSGQFDQSVQNFDETMSRLMPADKIKETWEAISQQVGVLKELHGSKFQATSQYDIVLLSSSFEQMRLIIKVVFDKNKQISGLFFLPDHSDSPYSAPEYADKDLFIEEATSIGKEPWVLPGTLSIPKGQGPFPLIILVHGSGPNDRDETIGPNKPFSDLAWGLASQQFAVYRYDKRTRVHGTHEIWTQQFTVDDEVIEDVNEAIKFLKNHPAVDPTKIVVLGHSLGAYLGPRMAARNQSIAGLILLAGPARPMDTLILEQYHYLFGLDGEVNPEEEKHLSDMIKRVERLNKTKLTQKTPKDSLPLNIPANYWLDLKEYHPTQVASELTIPILILQGERDYQVTMTDFDLWRESTSGKQNTTMKSYKKLNHLFMEGSGPGNPNEYQIASHIPEYVIKDLVSWLRNNYD